MTEDGIYLLRDDDDILVPMRSAGFLSEEVLQTLIAKHPDLLAGGQMGSREPRRWLLLSREMGVPKREGGSDHFSVDHLLVDQDAVPTIVEVKRSSDTRIRREVVGQMLDYAANGARYWTAPDLRLRLEATLGPDADQAQALLEELTADPSVDTDGFLQRVEDNLRSGRVRLVFVADVVPEELRSIVEFLNQQMSPADVFAVEIRQYVGDGVRTLVPRVVGATTAATQRKHAVPAMTYNELLADASAPVRAVDERVTALAAELGLVTRLTKSSRQVRLGHRTVLQFYPTWGENGALEINVGQLRSSGHDDVAQRAWAEMQTFSAGRTMPAKVPWVSCNEALLHWKRFAALVRDEVVPALS